MTVMVEWASKTCMSQSVHPEHGTFRILLRPPEFLLQKWSMCCFSCLVMQPLGGLAIAQGPAERTHWAQQC